jgi:hypothetical protein
MQSTLSSKSDNDFLAESRIRPTMRRSPKALDRERQLERLIGQANHANLRRAKRRPTPLERVLFDGSPAPDMSTPHLRKTTVVNRSRTGQFEFDPSCPDTADYDRLYQKVRVRLQKKNARWFAEFLGELFTAIARARTAGPVQPSEIILPDPISSRRLFFNADGTGRILDSPLRIQFEELYRLLERAELSRVRECASCGRLFWARRKDQMGCTKQCANRLRVSRFYLRAKNRIR